MRGFEFAAGPSVSLFELHAEQILHLIESAILYPRPAAVCGELERNNRIGRNGLLNFKAGARCGYVFQNCPLALTGAGCWTPFDLYKVSAKLSVFSSFRTHE